MPSLGHILLLEDDALLREQLSEQLEDQGYEVTPVDNGEAAIQAALKGSFDLLIADVRMAGLSGLDALERVQAGQPDISTLVMTGYASQEDSIRAVQLGVGNYLKKPFRLADFLASVQALVARRRNLQKQQERERALRSTARWALEAVARSLDVGLALPESLVESGRRAARLAQAMGMGKDAGEEIQLATLAAGLQQHAACPPELLQALPERALELLQGLENQDLPARIVRRSLTSDGGADPELDAALESDVAADSGFRPLVSLGRALEDRGETASALQAYQQVLDGAPRLSRESVEARLAVARMRGSGELAAQAFEQARELGAAWGGYEALEAAVLMAETGHPAAASSLEAMAGVGDAAQQARACLARAHFCQTGTPEEVQDALNLLMRPEHLDELAAASRWLLVALLERSHSPAVGRALNVLVRELPNRLLRLLESGRLSPQARRAAAAALAENGSPHLARLADDSDPEVRRIAQGTAVDQPAAPGLRIHSFGSFEVFVADEPVTDWRSQKARYLLALLASHGGKPVSEDLLEETFWAEDPAKSRQNLNAACSIIRKSLKAAVVNPVLRTSVGIYLNPELPRWHDVEEFEKALKQNDLARAAKLYRGPYLDGCYMDWALARRQRLEAVFLQALQAFFASPEARENGQATLDFARVALEIDPCCQEAHQACMRAYLDLGQPEQAVRQFETCQQLLRRELEMEPSIALLELFQRARLSIA